MTTYYMHTINGRPGQFCEISQQICYQSNKEVNLAMSLRQIRREQQASMRTRTQRGWDTENKYDYVRVKLPEGHR